MKYNLIALCILSSGLVACGGSNSENSPGVLSINGTAVEDQTLTTTLTDEDGLRWATYQWSADGVIINGEISDSLLLTSEHVGAVITAHASYTDKAGNAEEINSAETNEVEALPEVNVVGKVVISGATTVGQTLTAQVTDSNGTTGTITYSWAADGSEISGATASTYILTGAELAATITVTVSYTDDNGTDESLTSAATDPVVTGLSNTSATLTIGDSGLIVVGDSVSAMLTDPDGTSAATFVWSNDNGVIAGETGASYTPVASDLGLTLSVAATFTDDNGFLEDVSADADDITYSVIVSSGTELVNAATTAADGDWIGLASGDYVAMGEADFGADNLTIVLSADSTAQISGETCLTISGDGTTVDGLSFIDLDKVDSSACDSNGYSSVYITGTGNTLKNSSFLGEVSGHGLDEFSWVSVKGFQHIIERNLFSESNGGNKVGIKGSVITVYNSATVDYDAGHTIRYNLFEDFEGDSYKSSAYMIQLGRTSAAESNEDGLNTIEYNLFKNVNLNQRTIRVQSSNNVVDHNTFLDGSGAISFEDGELNTASNNIIIDALTGPQQDGGIAFGAYGHTITNNYIAGINTDSSLRAALVADADWLDNDGNTNLTVSAVTVANNTILNSKRSVNIGTKNCVDDVIILDFDNNLIANGEDDGVSGIVAGPLANGQSRTAIRDACDLNAASDFDGNHVYSSTTVDSSATLLTTDFTGNSGNVEGGTGEADVGIVNGLMEGQGVDTGKGADTSELELLDDTMVGPGSTWTHTTLM